MKIKSILCISLFHFSVQATAADLPNLPAPESDFKQANEQIHPMTPEEIREFRRIADMAKRAASDLPVVPPKPLTREVAIDLSPGAPPQVVRVSYGNGAVLSFIDSTGAHWPVKAFTNFNSRDFTVKNPVSEGHFLTVESNSNYGSGNVAVMLLGLPSPVTITLISGNQKATDYRVDLRIPNHGPNAKPIPVPVKTKPEFMADLSLVKDGIQPAGSTPVQITGAHQIIQGWSVRDQIMLRGRLTVLSPLPTGRETSADGTIAYSLPWTPYILASENGEHRMLVVKGDHLPLADANKTMPGEKNE